MSSIAYDACKENQRKYACAFRVACRSMIIYLYPLVSVHSVSSAVYRFPVFPFFLLFFPSIAWLCHSLSCKAPKTLSLHSQPDTGDALGELLPSSSHLMVLVMLRLEIRSSVYRLVACTSNLYLQV